LLIACLLTAERCASALGRAPIALSWRTPMSASGLPPLGSSSLAVYPRRMSDAPRPAGGARRQSGNALRLNKPQEQ